MEAVLLSITPAFVVQYTQLNRRKGQKLQRLKDHIEHPLAAILSLNTIAHTVGAAGAGAQATHVFGDAYVGVISAVLTFLILVFSEIIPKTLGAVYWRELTPIVVRSLIPIIWSMFPLVKMAEAITSIMTKGKKSALINREEFAALTKLGIKTGVFNKDESRIMQNLFRFRNIKVRDIMTPRTVIFDLEESMTVNKVLALHPIIPVSRIPIFGKNSDDVTGFVLKTDILLNAIQENGNTTLATFKRNIHAVPESLSLNLLFDDLINNRTHIALVIDEYGGTDGLVTQEDIIETLLGLEIVDEGDTVEDMQKLARQVWTKRAHQMGIIPEDEIKN